MNMNWKKLLRSIAMLLAMVMVLSALTFGLAGCAESGDDDGDDDSGKKEEIVDTSKMSGPEHLQYVEGKALGDAISVLTGVYSTMLGNAGTEQGYGTEMKMTVKLGDYLLDALKQSIMPGMEMDMSWLSEINLNCNSSVKGALSKSEMALGLAGTDILSMCCIGDLAKGSAWLNLPGVNSNYIELPFDSMDSVGLPSELESLYEILSENGGQAAQLMKALPSGDELNKLLDKYLKIALKSLEDVEKETVTLELDGLKQECTALTTTIDYVTVMVAAKNVLTEARDDKEILGILEDVAVQMGAQGDVTASFQATIDEMLASCEAAIENPEEGTIVLVTYTDNKNRVIGREISANGQTALSYKTVTQSGEFRFEGTVQSWGITGEGTVKGGATTGSYTLKNTMSDSALLTLELVDFNTEKMAKGYISGTVKLIPLEGLRGLIGMSIEGAELELVLDCEPDKSDVKVNVYLNGETIVGIALEYKITDADSIQIPNTDLQINDQNDLMQWVMGMNFKQIISNLKRANAPVELIDALESLVDQMQGIG